MSELLSYDRAVLLLLQVVEEFGEGFVYQPTDHKCEYVVNGAPSCLVAQILARAGVPLDELAGVDSQYDSSVSTNWQWFERWAEYRVVRLLAHVQDQQDGGATWGHAAEFALEQQIGEQE